MLFLVSFLLPITTTLASYDPVTGQEECPDGRLCFNHARCHGSNGGSYGCQCLSGFNGTNCQYAISCGDITLQNIVLTPNPYINTFGSVVTYKCLTNYQFIDVDSDAMETVHQRISRCDETGHWSPALVDCAVKCPPLETWSGYIVVGDNRLAGSSVRYTCWGRYPWYTKYAGHYQFKFKGGEAGDDLEYTSTCMGNGEWSPPIQECIEIDSATTGNMQWSLLILCLMSIKIFDC